MNFLKKILGLNDKPIQTYTDFWEWFKKNEHNFFDAIASRTNIEENVIEKISPKIKQFRENILFLVGMEDKRKAELIFTSDGNVKEIPFIEELVACAPQLKNWKFTALKSPIPIEDLHIEMNGVQFNSNRISFYENTDLNYPDEINITIVHHDLTEENRNTIVNGIYVFLDNYLGELNFVTMIDDLSIFGKSQATKDLVPIEKLKDYLIWRQKEFTEKNTGERKDTDKDNHQVLQAETEDGPMFALVNTDLLNWDKKASHPWMSVLVVTYSQSENNGMPEGNDLELLTKLEEQLLSSLKDTDGNLYLGRETCDNERTFYFACKDFRKPALELARIEDNYNDEFEIEYDIFKDKYWRSVAKFS